MQAEAPQTRAESAKKRYSGGKSALVGARGGGVEVRKDDRRVMRAFIQPVSVEWKEVEVHPPRHLSSPVHGSDCVDRCAFNLQKTPPRRIQALCRQIQNGVGEQARSVHEPHRGIVIVVQAAVQRKAVAYGRGFSACLQPDAVLQLCVQLQVRGAEPALPLPGMEPPS